MLAIFPLNSCLLDNCDFLKIFLHALIELALTTVNANLTIDSLVQWTHYLWGRGEEEQGKENTSCWHDLFTQLYLQANQMSIPIDYIPSTG